MGAHGEDISRPDALQGALQRAAGSGKPACVNVMIERLPAPRY
jgi:acetolactate synthase-1/2/3 large subunit